MEEMEIFLMYLVLNLIESVKTTKKKGTGISILESLLN